jgi:hypothetical protein
MPRKTKLVKRDLSREQEVMNAEINLSGAGEDPAIKALLSPDFASLPDTQAATIALALQQIIRGQASLLANQDAMSKELAAYRERMDKMEKASTAYESNKQKFIDDLYNQADKKRLPESKRGQLVARETAKFQKLVQTAKAEKTVEQLHFDDALRKMPKVMVTSMGVTVQTVINGEPTLALTPEEVHIKNHVWRLMPGVPTEVPQIVADRLQHVRRVQEETRARDKVLRITGGKMGPEHENVHVAQEWNAINKKYNAPSQDIFIPEER